jgi:heme exporter protein D
LALLIPILAMVYWIVASVMKHRERMAMIERGMDPDVR